ncbi:MAG TPA: YcxB family protein [Planctomycetota bacterium]|nr:YcxB family protein [Planctomycetota bacterium]
MFEMNALVISGQLQFGDYWRVNLWYLLRKLWFLVVLFVLAGVGYPALLLCARLFDVGQLRDVRPSVGAFLFVPGVMSIFILLTYHSARRRWASNKLAQQPVQYRFSADGVETSGALSDGRMSWDAVRAAHELQSSFVLFTADNQVNIIPKRFFQERAQIDGLREMLRQMLGQRAKVRACIGSGE